jgi:hypothetical protein
MSTTTNWRRLILEFEITRAGPKLRAVQGVGALTHELAEIGRALQDRLDADHQNENHLQAIQMEASAYGVDLRITNTKWKGRT